MKKRRLLHEDEPYLSNLLKHEHVIHNTVRYQELDSGVNTWGSHVVHRLYRLKKQKMDLDAYHNFMQSLKEEYNISFEMIVAEFIKTFFVNLTKMNFNSHVML